MYKIKKLNSNTINNIDWDGIPSINIDNFPWDKTGYKPLTSVKLLYTDSSLMIRFTSTEKEIRIEEKEFNSPSYQDSCVEFFFKPQPEKDDRYFNFEVTAAGTLLLELDDKTRDRETLNNVNPDIFNIKADVNSSNKSDFDNFIPWNVEYTIPFSFIQKYFKDFNPTSGYIMKGNFYKCGDKTKIPHYGCWNNIIYHKPSFHRPEFFGELVFE